MENQGTGSKMGIFVPIALVVAVAIVIVALATSGNGAEETANVSPTTAEGTPDAASGTSLAGSPEAGTPDTPGIQLSETDPDKYNDGEYTAMGHYISPGGEEEIQITLTLADGVVVDAEAVPQATRPTSVMMQNAFASGFEAMIVGKSLDEVKLDKVSGSSLTPKGFNDAVEQIKAMAEA